MSILLEKFMSQEDSLRWAGAGDDMFTTVYPLSDEELDNIKSFLPEIEAEVIKLGWNPADCDMFGNGWGGIELEFGNWQSGRSILLHDDGWEFS